MKKTNTKKNFSIIQTLFKRYFIDAMGAMALGLFSSLIIGLIFSQLSKIPFLSFLSDVSDVVSASSPVVGAAIGVAIAWGLKVKPLVMFSSAITGAIGYTAGGPVGAYIGAVVGAEVGRLVAGKTPVDIVVTPFVTLVSGGLVSIWVGPYISSFMNLLGKFINEATEFNPIVMGVVISVVVGLALTAPISSAALCIMISINGIAAGAAVVGCCCHMIGFAVSSFRDNGVGGLLSQGLGTSMIQMPNIMRHPQILIAPTLASAVLGPVSTSVLGMTNTSLGAGMGTSGLVGQFGAFESMSQSGLSFGHILVLVIIMHFIAPAALTLFFDFVVRKLGWVKKGYMTLYKIS